MLVEKEIISPGTYWYTDETTGIPRKLNVTPELTKYWHEQGSAMLSAGLTVPVPYEHDFSAHPMTPKDKLLNNAGEVKEYRLRDSTLYGVVDVQDPDVRRKIGHSIRWTSPWINSFTDGSGKRWNNVISHLALTTRPRVTKQTPFSSTATALSIATEIKSTDGVLPAAEKGYCLSRAGRLFTGKKTKRLRPRYPIAFSMWAGGVPLADDDVPVKKKPRTDGIDDMGTDDDMDGDLPDDEKYVPDEDESNDANIDLAPFNDPQGDVKMEELLCDLLNALGVQMPDNVGEAEFKRALYEATMSKIKELTSKGQAAGDANAQAADANTTSPAGNNNPIIQQEQQPMYMSLEEINKLPDPMRGVALAMYAENQKLRAEMDSAKKVTDSLRDAKLKEAAAARTARVAILSKLTPKVKTDLEAMLALPAMALSMGDGGAVNDPMAQTLAMLEKSLSDLPRMLATDMSALSVQAHPTDADALSAEQEEKLVDDFSKSMGYPAPEKKAG